MTIQARNSDSEVQFISLKGLNDESVCFNGWTYHNDYEGIDISYYIGEEIKEISHRFENNDSFDTHTIDLLNF